MRRFRIIAGLGNPGAEYRMTRHNMGFMVLDGFAGSSESWKEEDGGLRSELRIDGEKVILLKPVTFMNRSGEPLQSVIRYHRLESDQLIVVYDDIDLEFGKIRIRQGGGDGGHNGIRSIVGSLNDSNFVRVRVGIGRPADSAKNVADWVLEKFSKDELKELPGIIERAGEALSVLVNEGLIVAQQRFSN